jgi:hypothetical protein
MMADGPSYPRRRRRIVVLGARSCGGNRFGLCGLSPDHLGQNAVSAERVLGMQLIHDGLCPHERGLSRASQPARRKLLGSPDKGSVLSRRTDIAMVMHAVFPASQAPHGAPEVVFGALRGST